MSDKIEPSTETELSPYEYMAKCLVGPWTVEHQQRLPYDINIKAGDEAVVNMTRYTYAAWQKTLADCLNAVGIEPSEQKETQELLRLQIQLANLIASAPELLACLKWYVENDLTMSAGPEYYLAGKRNALAAINKAESKLIPS